MLKHLWILGLAVAEASAQAPSERATARLTREIRHEVLILPYYDIFDWVTFRLDGYKVVLSGYVSRPTLKADVERVVKKVEGVESVTNRIEVLPLSPNDDRIRQAVFNAIYRFPTLQRYSLRARQPIHIIVKNGNVSIVNLQARGVPGVFDVKNNLAVEK